MCWVVLQDNGIRGSEQGVTSDDMVRGEVYRAHSKVVLQVGTGAGSHSY